MVAGGETYRFELAFDTDHGLVRAVHSGKCSLADLTGFVDAVLTDPRWKPGMNVLSDFRKADPSEFSGDDMRQYVAHCLNYFSETIGTKVASVVESPLNYGIIRIWDAEAEIQKSPIENRIFDSMEEAENWLGVPQKR